MCLENEITAGLHYETSGGEHYLAPRHQGRLLRL